MPSTTLVQSHIASPLAAELRRRAEANSRSVAGELRHILSAVLNESNPAGEAGLDYSDRVGDHNASYSAR